MTTVPSDQQLIDFVLREARLLDQQRLEDWLDLFAEDGHYWMPVERGQTDPRLTTSLMYEDKLLLKNSNRAAQGQDDLQPRVPRAAATMCCRCRRSTSAMTRNGIT